MSHYSLQVVIDTERRHLAVSGEIQYPKPASPIDSLSFLLHRNLEVEILGKPTLFSVEPWPESSYNLISVSARDVETKGGVFLIAVRFSGTLRQEDMPYGIDRISQEYLELSANSMWLPVSARFDNYFTADIHLVVKGMNAETKLISSGNVTQTGRNTFTIKNEIPQIDVVLVASSAFDSTRYENITLFNALEEQPVEELIRQSKDALHWLNSHFGGIKRLEEGKLVITPRKESGYARKNLIILSDISEMTTEKISEYIAHEFAHFWSSKVNAQSPHRWIDESMAQFLTFKFMEQQFDPEWVHRRIARYNEEASSLPPVYTKESRGVPPHAVMYRKGVARLYWLNNRIGDDKIFAVITAWFAQPGRETEDFLNILKTLTDGETAEEFRQELAR